MTRGAAWQEGKKSAARRANSRNPKVCYGSRGAPTMPCWHGRFTLDCGHVHTAKPTLSIWAQVIIEHRAVLYANGQAFSEVNELYRRQLLSFPWPSIEFRRASRS